MRVSILRAASKLSIIAILLTDPVQLNLGDHQVCDLEASEIDVQPWKWKHH